MINLHAYCTVCKSEIPLFNSNAGNAIKINSNVACCGIEIIVTRKRKQIEAPKFAIENIATIKAKKNNKF